MASITRDPAGNITANTFATGDKRYGAGQGTAATSGTLGSAGYNARDRKKARSSAIQAKLPAAGGADPNSNPAMASAPWMNK